MDAQRCALQVQALELFAERRISQAAGVTLPPHRLNRVEFGQHDHERRLARGLFLAQTAPAFKFCQQLIEPGFQGRAAAAELGIEAGGQSARSPARRAERCSTAHPECCDRASQTGGGRRAVQGQRGQRGRQHSIPRGTTAADDQRMFTHPPPQNQHGLPADIELLDLTTARVCSAANQSMTPRPPVSTSS